MKRGYKTMYSRRELSDALDRKNTVRAFCSSLILAAIIPIYLLVVHFTGMYVSHAGTMKVLLITTEALQILSALIGYVLISRNELDKIKIYYRAYFYLSIVMLLCMGRYEMAYTGSMMIFLLSAVYCSVIPICMVKERRCFMIAVSLTFLIMTMATVGFGRTLIEVAVLCVGMYALASYIHETMIYQEKISLRLKAKTITSEKDPLTNLTNRRGLDRKAAVLWPYCARSATPLGLIEIDIDFFKKYNDRFGHPAGDKCLKLVAGAIRKSAQRTSDITARSGGEEFIVFVQGMSESDIVKLAMKIRNAVAELSIPHAYAGVSQYVTVSMGIALTVPGENNSFEDLYEAADKALYDAKENGRNCIVCNNKIYGRMKKGLATVISG